jgi:SPP1 gp7 family putative phage head morphogenesis protein
MSPAVRWEDLTPAKIQAIINSIEFELDSDGYMDELTRAHRDVIMSAGTEAMSEVESEDIFSIRDVATERYLASRALGSKIARDLNDFSKVLTGQINANTRILLTSCFAKAVKEAKGLAGIVNNLRDTFEDMEKWRADMIARTETAYALNYGQADGYKQAGIQAVMILDGDTPDTDEACAAANGLTVSLDLWMENPIQHPNCVRSAVPMQGEFAADELDDEAFLEAVGD